MTRESQLARWSGLASDSAACAIQALQPDLAVELLEQGRSVIWNQALHLRADLDRLTGKNEALAQRLASIRSGLDATIFVPAYSEDALERWSA